MVEERALAAAELLRREAEGWRRWPGLSKLASPWASLLSPALFPLRKQQQVSPQEACRPA
eukprot:364850-Chlamydomonas_euryale.AAC.3